MNRLKKKIFLCNFTKTISSAVLTAVAIVIVTAIDFYEYRYEKEDQINLDELEERIEKLEKEQ